MSTTVDNRVVEMQFDNKQFEKGVATSMSTLDKLKKKLNLSGASKGLEDIESAAKKVNFSGMSRGIESVSAKFSAMQIVGMTTIANLTNSAVNAGKRMISALTIDPVKTGFQEYETQMGAIQTILANTQHEGTNIKQVNAALDELNTYSDKTIYNFTEMTRNIGTFTAAGVDLRTSVESIKGIANLAATSGSTSQQASTVMYQLSQALAAGKVSLMDWNSVVNAGMGGKVFQDALTRTSELLGTGAKEAIATYGSFRESLTQGEWLTTEVLTETLKQFAGAYSEADLIAQGFTEQQAKDIAQMAKTAEDAATKVKTFTQLWGTLKEAAQSGWSQTWRMLVGDFEESKELFTELSDTFGGIIGRSAERRNNLLNGALTSSWDQMVSKIEEAGVSADIFDKRLSRVGKKSGYNIRELTEKYGSLKKAFQAGAISTDVLKKALSSLSTETANLSKVTKTLNYGAVGEDVAQVQSALQSLGFEFSKFGIDGILGAETEAAIKAFQEASGLKVTGIVDKATIKQLKAVTGETKDLSQACKSFADDIDKVGGRELLLGSFKNALEGILQVCRTLRSAWVKVFPPMKSDQLYNILEGLNTLSKNLDMSSEATAKLHRTFRGLFAVLSLILKITGSGLKLVFTVLNQVLSAFDMNILDLTANIGDAIYNFNEWIEQNSLIKKTVEAGVPLIIKMVEAVHDWVVTLSELPFVQNGIKEISRVFDSFTDTISNFMESIGSLSQEGIANGLSAIAESIRTKFSHLFDGIGEDTVAGFVNGLGFGINSIISAVTNIGLTVLDTIRDVLGIHSPSKETESLGADTVMGFYNGILSGLKALYDLIRGMASSVLDNIDSVDWYTVGCDVVDGFILVVSGMVGILEGMAFRTVEILRAIDFTSVGRGIALFFNEIFSSIGDMFSSLDLGSVFAGGALVATIVSMNRLLKVMEGFASPLQNLGNLIGSFKEGFENCVTGVVKVTKAAAFEHRAEGVKKLAEALLIISVAVAVLAYVDVDNLWTVVGVVAALSAILVVLSLAVSKISTSSVIIGRNAGGMKILSSGLVGIATSLLMLAFTVKILGSLNPNQFEQGVLGLIAMVGAIAALFAAYGTFVKGNAAKNMDKAGVMLRKLAVTMLLLAIVCKLVGGLSPEEFAVGTIFAGLFIGFVAALTAVTKTAGKNIDKVGSMVLKLSVAMMLMVGVCKLAGSLSPNEMVKGAIFAAAFVLFVKALISVTKYEGEQKIAKIGTLLLSLTLSTMLMVGVCKLAGQLNLGDMVKGGVVMLAFGIFVKAMVSITKITNEQQVAKIGGTILAMSVAIGVLAGVAILLGMVSIPNLAKGLVAVAMLGGVMTAMIWAARGVNDVKGTMIAMAAAIGVMAAAIIVLSFIDPVDLVGPTLAMSMLMGMFALMTAAARSAQSALAPLIVMVAAVGLFAGILYLLSDLPVESMLGTATSLSILMLALGKSMKMIGGTGYISPATVSAMGLMVVVVGLVGVIAGALQKFNLAPSIETAAALSVLLIAMSVAVAILSAIGPAATGAIAAAGAFDAVIVLIGGLAIGIGALMSKIPPETISEWKKGLAQFLDFMATLMKGLGEVAGAFLEGLTSSLTKVADNLSSFAAHLIPFITIVRSIDASAVNSVASLGKMIASLTGANIFESITSWFTGSSSMEKFGTQLAQFGDAIVKFSNKLATANIDTKKIKMATNAGMMMTKLSDAIPKTGGWTQKILGESDMVKFGLGIAAFGTAIINFSKAITTAGGVDEEGIKGAVRAGKKLAGLQDSIPKTGGWAQAIMGESDLKAFGKKMVAFGKSITEFSNNVDVDEEAVKSAARAGKAIANMQKAIPEEHWFDGKVSLDEFAGKIKSLGEGLSTYSDTVQSVDVVKISASLVSAQRIADLAKELAEVDPDWIDGFSADALGQALASYVVSIEGVETSSISESLESAGNLATFMKKLKNLDPAGVSKFKASILGEAIKAYSDSINGLNSSKVTTSITSIERLINVINKMSKLDTSGVSSFKQAALSLGKINFGSVKESLGDTVSRMSSIGSNMAESMSKGFVSKQNTLTSTMSNMLTTALRTVVDKVSAFEQAGSTLSGKLIAGLASKSSSIRGALTTAIRLTITAVREYWISFYNAGRYLGDGLIKGVDSKKKDVYDAAFDVGKTGAKGINDGQQSHSPSKLAIQSGNWLGEGLILGIKEMASKVHDAGYGLGNSAANSMSAAVSKMYDFANSGMDSQPTIRPVVDLSNVRTGISAINDMLNFNTSIGASANVNAIQSMGGRNQNGQSHEIISAINKLGKDLSNMGGNSYNINGITYDDGSNISDAVSQLIRAIRMERRA